MFVVRDTEQERDAAARRSQARLEVMRPLQLTAGQIETLRKARKAQPRPRQAACDLARFLSVGGDRLASDAEPATLHRKPRKATSAQTVNRKK